VIALRLVKDGAVVRETLFRSLPVTLGRGEECDFPLFDASVSRRHAVLERDADGALVLRDLGSRNGLHLGPQRVEKLKVASLVHCLVGTVELELEPLRDADTLEIRRHDWQSLERRRGPRAHLRSLALSRSWAWRCSRSC
jgi:pSer/pThr/pTyr-binding forkhead associated (FHA) protein